MGFDAGKSVTALDYDFSTITVVDPDQAEILSTAKGTIPEPSQEALDEFTKQLRAVATDPDLSGLVNLGSDPTPQEATEAIGNVPEEKLLGVMDRMLDSLIAVCAGTPSEEQVKALPPRIRNAFVGWLAGELLGPTKPTADSRPSLVGANGAGPGT